MVLKRCTAQATIVLIFVEIVLQLSDKMIQSMQNYGYFAPAIQVNIISIADISGVMISCINCYHTNFKTKKKMKIG